MIKYPHARELSFTLIALIIFGYMAIWTILINFLFLVIHNLRKDYWKIKLGSDVWQIDCKICDDDMACICCNILCLLKFLKHYRSSLLFIIHVRFKCLINHLWNILVYFCWEWESIIHLWAKWFKTQRLNSMESEKTL